MQNLKIDQAFVEELPADEVQENYIRQVKNACFSFVKPTPCTKPIFVHANTELAQEIGLGEGFASNNEWLTVLSGNGIYPNTTPYAMCYGGHQFGTWAGQLGDGRAINIFDILQEDKRFALQLKGAGKTPYSRSADGLAVLRSSIREYLCSEAMFHLGVPTTRALSLVLSGDKVLRDVMYDGNPAYEPGAIVCRVAPNFIRFGNFQILAARKDIESLKKLTDYTILHFFPQYLPSKECYVSFFREVCERTINLVLEWERVGFVHGVLNTDNMSILGLTIDYGPYGWLEDYDENWTPNTTDATTKRYRFGNQANIAVWNLYQLGNALYPLIEDAEELSTALQDIQIGYQIKFEAMMAKKLGLSVVSTNFVNELRELLQKSEMDFTLFFRSLAAFDGDLVFVEEVKKWSYSSNFDQYIPQWRDWLSAYHKLILADNNSERISQMNAVNPKYILRNYMAQMAIEQAEKEDYTLLNELYTLLQNPYQEQFQFEKWAAKRPDWAKEKIGCAMLSCSS